MSKNNYRSMIIGVQERKACLVIGVLLTNVAGLCGRSEMTVDL